MVYVDLMFVEREWVDRIEWGCHVEIVFCGEDIVTNQHKVEERRCNSSKAQGVMLKGVLLRQWGDVFEIFEIFI